MQTEKTNSEDSAQTSPESIALAELASFIEESKLDSEVAPIFKLSDLVKLYVHKLQQLKACVPDRVNSTRLKDRLLAQIPALRAQNNGREVFLVYDEDIGAALQFAVENSNDSNAVHLAKAAQIVRKDMLEKKQNFDGTFTGSCQKDSVPTSLLVLVTMMLEGLNIQDQTDLETIESDIALTISQLLLFNMVKHRSVAGSARDNTERETPLAIDLGLLVHAQTRSKELINKLRKLGLSVSYDRVLSISAAMANSVCMMYEEQSSRSLAIIALLPLFREVAHSAAMTLHSMKIIKNAVEYLNPGQAPVICLDQSLFAIAKQIQWERKHIYGEDKVVIMMGALHIEMKALIVIGDWLKDSGWESLLVNANISMPGRVNAMLKASHLTRTRYAPQVTACVLYILQKRAYDEYVAVTDDNQEPIGFHDWCKAQADQYPQIKYWLTVPELEILVLGIVKSLRVGDFPLYVQSLNKLAPWMFALNQYNYAHWLPVHIRDMELLKERDPAIYEEFLSGKFVVHKTSHAFSMIALDHNHEQENAKIKGEGEVVGLTEDQAALRCWLIAGPEIARVVNEFETTFLSHKADDVHHHKQVPSIQTAFAKDVRNMLSVMDELGNPFLEDSKDLIALDTKDICQNML